MVSINTKIKQLMGLQQTKDLSDWENNFVQSIKEKTQGGNLVGNLSDNQVEKIEQIWGKHFA